MDFYKIKIRGIENWINKNKIIAVKYDKDSNTVLIGLNINTFRLFYMESPATFEDYNIFFKDSNNRPIFIKIDDKDDLLEQFITHNS